MKKGHRKIQDLFKEEFIDLYYNNKQDDIVELYSCSGNAIALLREKYNIPRKRKKKIKVEDGPKI